MAREVEEMDIFLDSVDVAVSDDALGKVSAYAQRMLAIQSEIGGLENAIKALKEEFKNIEQVKLPDTMLEAGVSEFKLASGEKVTVRDTVHGSIPEEKKPEAFKWLREHDYGDLIKNKVELSFSRGEDQKVAEIKALLQEKFGVQAEQKESVHPSTLSSFCKEQLAKGVDLPLDLLGLWAGRKAVVKAGR